jgi:propanol-preferring alcohol dehydrogenase
VVVARELVPLTTLDPATAAPLSDAGVTAYHAVRKVAPRLVGGTTAVVIGVGGLGSFAVQFLHQLTGAHMVALDTHEHRLRAAARLGAHSAVMQADIDELIEERTSGQGADVVMDFVGISETMAFALRSTRARGAIAILGAAGGTATIGWGRLPTDCDLFIPMGGTTAELHDVVAYAESGRITVDIERFAFDDIATAYSRVEAGDISGRAVVDVT